MAGSEITSRLIRPIHGAHPYGAAVKLLSKIVYGQDGLSAENAGTIFCPDNFVPLQDLHFVCESARGFNGLFLGVMAICEGEPDV